MNRVLTIARNTFRENIRDKILYNLILFALLMILCSFALGQLTLGHEDRVIIDIGLASISIFGTLIAIFIGIQLVYKEMERRTVYALLSKPVERWEFVLGKYLGLLLTLSVNVAIMGVGLMLTLLYHGAISTLGYLGLLPPIYLILMSLAVTTALALLFSTFSTPTLSAVFTFFLWVIGHFNADLLEFGKLSNSAAIGLVCRILYYVLPNIANFKVLDSKNVIQGAAHYQPVDFVAVAWTGIYGLVYCAILLALAIAIFSRRDFK